jgi:hypothetical protein
MAYLQTTQIAVLAGMACGGGAELKSYTGTVIGTAALNFAHSHAQSAVMNIASSFAHSGYIVSYGCCSVAMVSTGNSLCNIRDNVQTTSSNGGSWTYAKITNANTSIVKNAGTYPGGGYYSVNIWGFDMQ